VQTVRLRSLKNGVMHGPGAQEATPLCSYRGLVRLGSNSYRHCPRAISPEQCYALEPSSCRTSSSTETNTVPLVVVCSAWVRCVVHNTEGLH
jgi:hypothetical protein